MLTPAPSATACSDTVVELIGVSKVFYQRQRSEQLGEVFANLFRPRVKKVQALQDVDLSIRRGEVVAYAGPNGAGKSTTIKLLASLLSPDAGIVRSLGMDPVRDRVRYVGRIGVVFGQRTELWWDHPVAASFDWKRVVWDIPRERYDRMCGRLREMLDLEPIFHTLARELSLGQKMRAELGLALLHEPEILFLDEPTLGLDVLAKRRILEFIRELNREQRMTIMVTSHDMGDLEQLAGRIVMIHQGRIAFDGDFQRLRREVPDHRRLLLETASDQPPVLEGARYLTSEGNRHEFVYDAAQVRVATLLEQATAQGELSDVETHRAPLEDVIAEIYTRWQEAR